MAGTSEPQARRYGVTLRATGDTTITVEATSPGEAMKIAERQSAEGELGCTARFEIELVEWDVLDSEGQPSTMKAYRVSDCEGCGRPILDTEKYASDEDGCCICFSCLLGDEEMD